jgi:transcriptional regulator with XRE-family HTH domain
MKMDTYLNIGNKVKDIREKSRLSQTQLAHCLDVDQSNISKCEKGERQFTIDALEKLCNLFGCEMADLLDLQKPVETLNFAFRADTIENEDLIAISDINKIALNIRFMRQLLEKVK